MSKKQPSEVFEYHPFAGLKKIIESRRPDVPAASRQPAAEKMPSDEELFHSAMKEVLEIKEFRKLPVHRKKILPARKKCSGDREVLDALRDTVQGRRPIDLCKTQEYVEWTNKDYRGDIIRRLREGRISVQDCLDLHGLSVEEAESEVEEFLREALRKGRRCIKIIHGRGLRSPGGPVIKEALIKWLSFRHRKNLIAFVTARQCDGGLGALYVLLR